MLVTRRSLFSGQLTTLDLPITQSQMDDYLTGELVQKAFPDLTEDQREFILTGALPGEWEAAFPDEPLDLPDDPFDGI